MEGNMWSLEEQKEHKRQYAEMEPKVKKILQLFDENEYRIVDDEPCVFYAAESYILEIITQSCLELRDEGKIITDRFIKDLIEKIFPSIDPDEPNRNHFYRPIPY